MIEVGEYVRTNRGIGKVLEVKTVQPKMYGQHDVVYKIDICPRMYITKTNILKHSSNIIDLIEVGDIVEYRVNSLSELKAGRVKGYRDARNNKEYLGIEGFDITKIYIETILTKEQYIQNCYTVERKEEWKK